jgi:soluble lytic murein transglycosylase-like protein
VNIDQHIEEPGRGSKLDPARKLKLAKAVREFESVFVGYMLKSMRNTIQKADNSSDGFGTDMLEGMFDVEFAKHISKGSNLGLADMLYRKMTGEPLEKNSPLSGAIESGKRGVSKKRAEEQKIEQPKVELRKAQPAVRKSTIAQPALVQNPVTRPTVAWSGFAQPTIAQAVGKPDAVAVPFRRVEQRQANPTLASLVAAQPKVAARDAVRVASTHELKVDKKVARTPTLQDRMKKFDAFIAEASEKHGVSENLIKAVIAAESGGRVNAESTQSAKGVMQLIDSTATAMGVRNVWDPRQNILGGVKYLAQLLNRFDGDEKLAVASYNAGPGNVMKHGGIPPFKETKQYVARVMNLLELFKQQEETNE